MRVTTGTFLNSGAASQCEMCGRARLGLRGKRKGKRGAKGRRVNLATLSDELARRDDRKGGIFTAPLQQQHQQHLSQGERVTGQSDVMSVSPMGVGASVLAMMRKSDAVAASPREAADIATRPSDRGRGRGRGRGQGRSRGRGRSRGDRRARVEIEAPVAARNPSRETTPAPPSGVGRGRGGGYTFDIGLGLGRGAGAGRGHGTVEPVGIRFETEASVDPLVRVQGEQGPRAGGPPATNEKRAWEFVKKVTNRWEGFSVADPRAAQSRQRRKRGDDDSKDGPGGRGRGGRKAREPVRFVNTYLGASSTETSEAEDPGGSEGEGGESALSGQRGATRRGYSDEKGEGGGGAIPNEHSPDSTMYGEIDRTLETAYRFNEAEGRARWGRPQRGSVVLHVAEKPSIAEALAKAFAPDGHYTTQAAHPLHTALHTFKAPFLSAPDCTFRVTSVAGHVFRTDYEQGFESWEQTDPLLMFRAPTRKIPGAGAMLRHLSVVGEGSDYLVLWLDCDPEGENICFEVMEAVCPKLRRGRGRERRVYRAVFSSLAPVDLRRALAPPGTPGGLQRPDENVSRAVDARQILDLKMGVAFTRFQSVFLRGRFSRLSTNVVSFGPCQTPTLGFCVARQDEIEAFTPEPFWRIRAELPAPAVAADPEAGAPASARDGPRPDDSVGASTMRLEWARGRIFDKDAVVALHELAAEEAKGFAIVASVDTAPRQTSPPLPLCTTALLKAASRGLGLSPHEAMRAAENLYMSGYVSYPRTETTAYARNFDLLSVLGAHAGHPDWGDCAQRVLAEAKESGSRPRATSRGGIDAGDHPPITPVRCAQRGELSGREWRVYDFISRHFIASLMPVCAVEVRRVEFRIGSHERFVLTGTQVLDLGFTVAMTWLQPKGAPLPREFTAGDRVPLARFGVEEGATQAPDLLTEAELIERMEKHGIGTDASIATHIKGICDRGYVKLKAGRRLAPSTLGVVLAHAYAQVDPALIQPTSRAAVERELKRIAGGTAGYRAVLDHCIRSFAKKFIHFRAQSAVVSALFEARFGTTQGDGFTKDFSKCGRCRSAMQLRPGARPPTLSCATCDTTYALPPGGTIKLFSGRKCPFDGFELISFKAGGPNGIAFPVCPLCYAEPPFEDIARRTRGAGRGMACPQCRHPTCPQSEVSLGVCPCPYCRRGTMVFDPVSRPVWKVACNQCDRLVKFAQNATRVKLMRRRCETCRAREFSVHFHPNHSPLAEGELVRKGCLACDPHINATTDVVRGHLTRGGRGGRRRGGRGGGDKAPAAPDYEVQMNAAGGKSRRITKRGML